MDLYQISQMINDNHTEVCQRLTALETQNKGLPERVSDLEHFKYKLLGVNAAFSVMAAGAMAWFKRH